MNTPEDVQDALESYAIPEEAYVAFCEDVYMGVASFEDFQDSYQGQWDSEEEFTRQVCDDLGITSDADGWPLNHINWEAAANELFTDYTSVEAQTGGYYIFRL